LRALPSLLRTLLTQALEGDTFAAVEVDPSPEALSTCLQVLQETHVKRPTHSQLASPNTKVIAIVDRTANLATAAEHLVAARFAFGGTSPYAPDVVLVNEFVKREFLEQTLKYAIPFLTGSEGIDSNEKSRPQTRSSQKSSRVAEMLKKAEDSKAWKLNIITQGSNGAVVELGSLSALPPKASQPLFAVAAVTSLEHAISLIDEDSQDESGLLAAYHFGTPSAGKYLSQFIKADVSLVNHVDYRLLVGPAAPSSYTIDLDNRYSTEQFTRAVPAYVTTVQTSVSKIFVGKESRKAAAALLANATQEIKEKKRAEWIAIGFFEQGILIGLGLYGIPILTCVGASLFFGVRAGLQRWVF
jgi:aldehyde dehydrogenase (NAD+)